MAIEDFYSIPSQQYGGSKVSSARQKVSNINQNREQNKLSIVQPANRPSQALGTLNTIISDNLIEKQAQETANKEQMYANALKEAGLGDMSVLQNAISAENNYTGSLKLSPAIKKIADQNLKYSQGRGSGCTDCSAFTQKIFKDTYGVNIGGNTETQWKTGKKVNLDNVQPGNLLFFKSPKQKYKNRNVTHVGVNNGDGTMTHFGTGGLSTVPIKGYSLPLVGARSYI